MRRPDELDLAATADFGEVSIFGEEPVTGVNGLHVADFGGADDPVDHQVAFRCGIASDAIRFVGELQVTGIAVGFAEDRHGFDPHFTAGADDPQGDLAAIGDQDALKHGRSFRGDVSRVQ